MSLQVVQLTDIHLCDDPKQVLLGVNPEDSFDRVVSNLKQKTSMLNLLLITGDLTQDGGKPAYRRLAHKINSLGLPVYFLPGNHDHIPHMEEVLGRHQVGINRSVLIKNWHLVLLNSAVPGQVAGNLGSRTLEWLNRILRQYPDRPTLIALHHPVLPIGCSWLDRLGLQDAAEFWEICGNYSQVRGVITGHAHQEHEVFRFTPRGMIHCMVSPSTCAQFKSGSPEFATDTLPPGFRQLQLYAGGDLTTTIERVN